jgi:hypothetical protein
MKTPEYKIPEYDIPYYEDNTPLSITIYKLLIFVHVVHIVEIIAQALSGDILYDLS